MRRTKLDLSSLSSHNRATLLPVDDVLERLKIRSDGYTNMDVERVSELDIHWADQDDYHRSSGYYASIDGRDMQLTDQAMRGASKMVQINDISHWDQFPDRDAFGKQLRHILENPSTNGKRMGSKPLLVRHDGINVRAIQPMTYKIKDAFDLLSDFVEMIHDNVGDIQGISVIESGDGLPGEPGDICSYRVIVNENIVPTLKSEFGQYMMFLLNTSETGAIVHKGGATAATALGCFRTICTNSSIRQKLVMTWNHKESGLGNFMEGSGERIQQIGYYQDQYSRVFGELSSQKLVDIEPADLLLAFKTERLITSGHYDASEFYLGQPTEDGRDNETQYDMFNVLTRGAQDLPTLSQRNQAESTALALFTEPGGVFKQLGSRCRAHSLEEELIAT